MSIQKYWEIRGSAFWALSPASSRFEQRASAGLVISEATAVSPEGFGWADTPGLWSEEQVRGWRRVMDAVHAAGGRMIAQLWHTEAISHPELRTAKNLPAGVDPSLHK